MRQMFYISVEQNLTTAQLLLRWLHNHVVAVRPGLTPTAVMLILPLPVPLVIQQRGLRRSSLVE